MITKQILNYYNTNFSLEITSKVQKVNQKYTFTHKLTTKRNFQTPSLFFSSTITEWNAQDCGISKAAKDTSMLPSKINQMKASHETGSEANFGLGRALMPSYLGMCPPKAAFFSFRMQPWSGLVCVYYAADLSLTSSFDYSSMISLCLCGPRHLVCLIFHLLSPRQHI